MEEKKHFGVYEVIEEIGRGGMSIVYKAKHPTLGKMVAIKVLPPFLSNDRTFIERFRNEAQILSSFRHQNIVYVIDFAKEANQYYIVMDLIDGYTVKQLIQNTGALPSKIACNIIKNVCTALSYTHRKGIVHRDIKSSNIMVDGNGKIMVTDFGLSKETNVDALKEGQDEIAGTLSYISPEQLDPKLGKTDIRTDIYSLGIVFYEMVTGKLPFDENSTPVNLIYQHLHTTPPAPSQIKKDLLPKMDAICLKMLEKKQNMRYQSTEELLKDLEELDGILQYYKAPEETEEGSYFKVILNEYEKVVQEPKKDIETKEEMKEENREEISIPPYQEDDIYIGKVVSRRYRVEKLLLKRILSSLYEGRDLQIDKKIMIQIPNESRPTFRTWIEKEIQTMKKVDYPGFVKFIEVVEEDGSCYVIREYVEGSTIKQLLKQQSFDIQQAVNIILKVLESLKYLHDHGIIHRDLNSDVVIITNHDQVKIISLGFTRIEDASSVSSGEFLGVVQYTSPEQITQSKSDFRSDIYSIGILLFEMLTGTLPFDSPLPVEVMDMHLKKTPRLPEEAQKKIPLNLQRILLKALAKSPEQRYQTTDEMIAELKNFLQTQQDELPGLPNPEYPLTVDADKVMKGITEQSVRKKNDLNFTIKKKPTPVEEVKKVDVKQMIEEGMNNLTSPKPMIKVIPSKPPIIKGPSTVASEKVKADIEKQSSSHQSSSHDTSTIKEEPIILSERSNKSKRYKTLLYLFLIAALLAVGWFVGYQKCSLLLRFQGIEVILPAKPYQIKSFVENTYKVQTKSKLVKSIQIESSEKGLTSKIEALENNQYMIYFYPTLMTNQASIPVSLVGLNEKGKEVVRTQLVLELSNESMTYLVIDLAKKEVQRVKGTDVSTNALEFAPITVQEELFLPIRSLITQFNGQLSYDFEQEKLTITGMDQHTYQLFLFQNQYQIDEKVYREKTPYIERNDIGYLPFKFLTEKMGFAIQTSYDAVGDEIIKMAKAD